MGLTERITDTRDLRGWHGEIPVAQQHSVGPAGERFLREIKDQGRFMATRCSECGLPYLPPRLYCERCFSELTDWEQVPNCGRVHSFTILHIDLDGNPLPEPQIYAVVHLEGTHGGVIHRLGRVRPESLHIGMDVEALFREKAHRIGSILNIEYFRPRDSVQDPGLRVLGVASRV